MLRAVRASGRRSGIPPLSFGSPLEDEGGGLAGGSAAPDHLLELVGRLVPKPSRQHDDHLAACGLVTEREHFLARPPPDHPDDHQATEKERQAEPGEIGRQPVLESGDGHRQAFGF